MKPTALLCLLLALGCAAPPTPEKPLDDALARGGFTTVRPHDPQFPLHIRLEIAASGPLEVLFEQGGERWRYTAEAAPAALVLPGLHPGEPCLLRVTAGEKSERLSFPAPEPDFPLPPLEVVRNRPGREPGHRLFNLMREAEYELGLLAMVDGEGRLCWLFSAPKKITDARALADGRLLCLVGKDEAWELDVRGAAPLRRWHAANLLKERPPGSIPVACDTFHHELLPLTEERWAVLSTELVKLDYPTSETDPDAPRLPTWVVGDVVVEFEPASGAVLREISMLELLDPQRLGYLSLSGLYNGPYGKRTADWSHGNAILHDPRDDSYILSLRHQDALVKVARATGEVVWILGDPKGWEEPWRAKLLRAPDDFPWPYHQHAPSFTPDGDILLFDNGNFRALPHDPPLPAEECRSRAQILRVDEAARTVEEVWSYAGGAPFYSPWLGDAQWLPATGTVLIVDGGRTADASGAPTHDVRGSHHYARLLEVRPPDGEVLFELAVGDPRPGQTSWAVYRAEPVEDPWRQAGWTPLP